MPRMTCPKCNEALEEVLRVIKVRCRFDEDEDDYLTDRDEGYFDLCPKCRTELKSS